MLQLHTGQVLAEQLGHRVVRHQLSPLHGLLMVHAGHRLLVGLLHSQGVQELQVRRAQDVVEQLPLGGQGGAVEQDAGQDQLGEDAADGPEINWTRDQRTISKK